MPIGYSSPARNLFLLGSSGAQVVTNFFKQIDQASSGDFFHTPSEIRYTESDEKFILAGQADKTSPSSEKYGWIEKRQENGTQDWEVQVSSTTENNTTLRALELDGFNLVAVGKTGGVPWIAKYTDGGVITWQSTTNSGDVEYTGVAVDSNSNYYACGSTPVSGEAQAFVEKFDSSGNPGWGKSAFMVGRDVVLNKISANSRGEVVAVGYLEDDSYNKGYIVKIDTTTGDVMWDRTLELNIPAANIELTGVDVDNNDEIYVCGNIKYDVFGQTILPVDGFIAKYTAEGNLLWQSQSDYASGTSSAVYYEDITIDNTTKKPTTFGYVRYAVGDSGTLISRYDPDGSLSWRREIDEGNSFDPRHTSVDGDQSFIYLLFADTADSETYVYGKVSATGNGLGDFEYDDGTGAPLLQYITSSGPSGSDIGEKIGRLSDGSVRQDTSDLITYPFNANKLLFDDLATHVSNKKRQMDSADSFEYSGSPAIRPADFQELNLLGSTGFVDETTGGGGSITLGAQTWSNDLTTANPNNGFNEPATQAFDGVLNDTAATSSTAGGNQIVWSPSQFPAANGPYTLEVLAREGNSNGGWGQRLLKVNGTTYFDPAVDTLPTDFITVSNLTEITEVIVERQSGTSGRSRLDTIKVNGTELIDGQGITLPVASTTTSKVKDQSGKGNDGVVNGATHNSAGYWEFDGVDDKIVIDSLSNFAPSEVTFEAWFKKPTGSGYKGLVDKGRDNYGAYTINVDEAGNKATFTAKVSGVNGSVVCATQYGSNVWTHVTGTYDGIDLKIYLNGSLDGTTNLPGVLGSNTVPVTIGSTNDGLDYGGEIGEVRIYPRALTAAQVFQNYNATKSKYINEAPDIAPKISDSAIVYDSNLLLNYDFGNRATYDRVENLVRNSQDIVFYNDNYFTSSSIDAVVEAVDVIAPDGSTDGVVKFLGVGQTGRHTVRFQETLPADTKFTFSIYVKVLKGVDKVSLETASYGDWSDSGIAKFNIVNGTVIDETFQGASIHDVGNGWFLIKGCSTTNSNGGSTGFYINILDDILGNNPTLASDEGVYLWQPQIEVGEYFTPTRVIKTYGSAITAPTTVKNLSISSYTGTINGATFNNAGYFETTDSAWVSSGYGATGTSDMTIEQWVRANSFPVIFHSTFYSQSSNASGFYGIGYGTTNGWFFGDYNGSVRNTASSGTTASVNTWYHFVARRSGGNLTVHINGVDITSTSASTSISFTAADPRIGNNPAAPNGEYWDGDIAETRIYNRALSSTEISQNFNATRSKYGV